MFPGVAKSDVSLGICFVVHIREGDGVEGWKSACSSGAGGFVRVL